MGDLPTFETFYAAVNPGREPFPWQARLATQVRAHGWPLEIGVPTGLGKTTCLDVALWTLASQASLPPAQRTLPTRIWYVVNRRLLVDAAYEHGCRLAVLLRDAGGASDPADALAWPGAGAHHLDGVRAVADALRTIRGVGGVDDDPLVVSRLRGGAELGARPPHPAQPALVFATVPMFGSTWLFRGYASSPGMRSVDAAHAGIDALVLLDEAHLARPLRDLCGPVGQCDVGDPALVVNPVRARPLIVSLTATGDADNPFLLDDVDHVHPVVRQRLDAVKRVALRGVAKKARAIAADLVAALRDSLADSARPVAAVVFVNTPERARAVCDLVGTEQAKRGTPLAGADLRLLTGRMRRREADVARAVVLDPEGGAPAGRNRSAARERHLVVVATQTLEVGADLDFDALVTESCGARALIQRLGRLNRLGEAGDARGVVVHPADESDWGLYGDEPATVWDRLTAADEDGNGIVELPPGAIAKVIGDPHDQPARVAELLPAHLWEWAKTTTAPPGEAPVELFFEGFDTDGPRVSLCWRATRFAPGDRLVPSVSVGEAVEIPLWEARQTLVDRIGDGPVFRLARDRVTVESVAPTDLQPRDIVVLHVGDGLYDDHGWSPDGQGTVLDVSLEHWPGLPLDVESIRHWVSDESPLEDLVSLVKRLRADDDELDESEVAAQLVAAVQPVIPRPEVDVWWRSLVAQLVPRIDWSGSLAILARRPDRRRRRETMLVAADAFDDLSADVRSVGLAGHLASVGAIASRLARAAGLPDELVVAAEAAGRFHDLGKADPRFQRWLDPHGAATGPLAKSSTPRTRWRADRATSGWPEGGRHEALSARILAAWLDQHGEASWDRDLVIHLVVSHHGYGRPLVVPVVDDAPTACSWSIEGAQVTVSGNLAVADWDQPARFRRCCERYGYWGLALLEAIVRQADHMASSHAAGVPVEVA